jgi:outer membrane protein assembly factor BamB
MNDTPEMLYAGVGRTIVAIDPVSGHRFWDTKLPFFGGLISMFLPHKDRLYVGRRSSVSCLDRATGRLLWTQDIGRSGLVLLSISGVDQQQVVSAHAAHRSAGRSKSSDSYSGSGAAAATTSGGGSSG